MNIKNEAAIRLQATVFSLALFGSAAALTHYGPRTGPARFWGQWLWAASLLLLAHFMFFVPLRRWLSHRQLMRLELALLLFAAAAYAYAWWVGQTLHPSSR